MRAHRPNYRSPGKHQVDPQQASLALDVVAEPATPAEVVAGAGKVTPTPKPVASLTSRRVAPRRARISFEAPQRLNRSLERVARELDRSKTALLREALVAYLKKMNAPEGEA